MCKSTAADRSESLGPFVRGRFSYRSTRDRSPFRFGRRPRTSQFAHEGMGVSSTLWPSTTTIGDRLSKLSSFLYHYHPRSLLPVQVAPTGTNERECGRARVCERDGRIKKLTRTAKANDINIFLARRCQCSQSKHGRRPWVIRWLSALRRVGCDANRRRPIILLPS